MRSGDRQITEPAPPLPPSARGLPGRQGFVFRFYFCFWRSASTEEVVQDPFSLDLWTMRFLALLAVFIAARAWDLDAALQDIAAAESAKYNCSISIAYRGRGRSGAVISGASDFATGRKAELSDKFVWGSITKVLTGASVMRLVQEGVLELNQTIPSLVESIMAKMAAAEPSKGYSARLSEYWGKEVDKVTVRDLLGMMSGIPDFDTAKPDGKYPTDSFRQTVYDNPEHMFSPLEIFSLDWVKKGELKFPPGERTSYSSTNFMLLGLILAQHAGADSWDQFNQLVAVPEKVRGSLSNLSFGVLDPPSALTPMHGYDRTNYNNQTSARDVYNVKGVFSGWTASDVCATTAEVAELAYSVYGPENLFLSKDYSDLMIPTGPFYGLATFNLSRATGKEGPDGRCYGHLGATYGYDSILAYHPTIETAIAVGTSLETTHQTQPSDTLCGAFNTVFNHARGLNAPKCEYIPSGYYGGECKCTTPP